MKYIVCEGKYGYEIHTAKENDPHAVTWEMAVSILVNSYKWSKA
jgi:hypothetical protein